MTLTEVDILEVWNALGGDKLQGCRGRAFWRGGDGYNVTLDFAKDVWFDHRDGKGGGVLDIVRTVLGCDISAALKWLEENCGLDSRKPVSRRQFQARKRKRAENLREGDVAECFAITARALSEEVLERMNDSDLRREIFTRLLAAIRGEALLEEFRGWSADYPELTTAMVRAGRASRARIQEGLAHFINQESQRAA